jgi:cell wall assembly regulator SMI1
MREWDNSNKVLPGVTPLEIIHEASTKKLSTEDGDRISLTFHRPLSEQEIAAFEARLPCPLPPEIRELLKFCKGFTGGATDFVDFTGQDCVFDHPAFPHGLPIAPDGFGNFWVVDLVPESKCWGPIYFVCHDPPIVLYQSASLEDFLTELFKKCIPPRKSAIDDVHDDRLFQVWRNNPGALTRDECLRSRDDHLRAFSAQLDAFFLVIDLRNAVVGSGFSWGRYGPNTVVRRYGTFSIFAYQRPTACMNKS